MSVLGKNTNHSPVRVMRRGFFVLQILYIQSVFGVMKPPLTCGWPTPWKPNCAWPRLITNALAAVAMKSPKVGSMSRHLRDLLTLLDADDLTSAKRSEEHKSELQLLMR